MHLEGTDRSAHYYPEGLKCSCIVAGGTESLILMQFIIATFVENWTQVRTNGVFLDSISACAAFGEGSTGLAES